MTIQYDVTLRLVAAALFVFGAGCSSAADPPSLIATRAEDSTGSFLELSRAPSEVAASGSSAPTLEVAFDVGGSSTDLGYPIDVEELPDGRIVLLDRETPGLTLLDRTGRLVGRANREGDGPGELRSPIGLTRVGAELVITGSRNDRTLMIADTGGRPLRHFGPAVPGDWARATQRPSLVGTDIPWYPAAEDVALRLATFDDSSVAVVVAASERESTPDPSDADRMLPRPVAVIRVSVQTGRVIDTLWRGLTPEASRDQFRADLVSNWPYPRFAPLPLLASGAGWVAVTDGGSGEISVMGKSGIQHIRWDPTPTRIDDALKERQFEWFVQQQSRYTANWAEWWDSLGTAKRADGKEWQIGYLPWAQEAPQVTAMLGHGNCLWVAGFAIEDGPLGVGRTWIVVDVAAGVLLGTARIPGPWWRLRSIGPSGAFATYRDDDGLSHLVKLTLPAGIGSCAN